MDADAAAKAASSVDASTMTPLFPAGNAATATAATNTASTPTATTTGGGAAVVVGRSNTLPPSLTWEGLQSSLYSNPYFEAGFGLTVGRFASMFMEMAVLLNLREEN